jgi:hypothetical protein
VELKRYVRWSNQNLKNLINEKRKLHRKYKRTADTNVLAKYGKKRNEVRTKNQKAREKSWEDFVSSTNKQSSTTELYSKVRKLSGKYKNKIVTALHLNNTNITDPKIIVNKLAENFNNITKKKTTTNDFKIK